MKLALEESNSIIRNTALSSNPGAQAPDSRHIFMVKLLRAAGGCLGINRRRRTCKPAKIFGELERSFDPEESEWGNPVGVMFHHHLLNR